jgi:hypothetical protein
LRGSEGSGLVDRDGVTEMPAPPSDLTPDLPPYVNLDDVVS